MSRWRRSRFGRCEVKSHHTLPFAIDSRTKVSAENSGCTESGRSLDCVLTGDFQPIVAVQEGSKRLSCIFSDSGVSTFAGFLWFLRIQLVMCIGAIFAYSYLMIRCVVYSCIFVKN